MGTAQEKRAGEAAERITKTLPVLTPILCETSLFHETRQQGVGPDDSTRLTCSTS